MPSAESSNQKTKADDEKEFKLPSTTNSMWWIEGKLIYGAVNKVVKSADSSQLVTSAFV